VPRWSLLLLTSVKKKKMTLSMAPGSQEASFLTVEEEAVPSTSVSKKSVSFILEGLPGKVDQG
jgi:hypothetical protein